MNKQWWFLAKDAFKTKRPAVAFGPYPSHELCRLAARDLMPDDRRFWTDEQIAEGERQDAIKRTKRLEQQRRDEEAIAATTVRDGWLKLERDDEYGTCSVYIDKHGKATGAMSYSGGRMYTVTGPEWRALSGCVEIDADDPH